MWPENWDAVRILIACHTQWIVHVVMTGPHSQALRYQGLDIERATTIATRWLGIETNEALLWQLRILEDEAKPLRNAT